MKQFALLITMCFLFVGCVPSDSYTGAPNNVVIISYHDPLDPQVAAVVTEAEQISKCEALFPKYRSIPASHTAGGWKITYEFYFNFGGRSLRVFLDGEDWSMGHGDFPINGDLKKLISELKLKK